MVFSYVCAINKLLTYSRLQRLQTGYLLSSVYVAVHIRFSQKTNLNVSMISVQPCRNTCSSSMVTLARPPTRSSLKITNRSFQYAAPCLWNELPTDLREPCQTQSPSLSPITHGSSSLSSSPSSRSPLASFLTCSLFYSELKTWLFSKSFPP